MPGLSPELVERNLRQLLEKYSLSKKLTVGMVRRWIRDEKRRSMEAVHSYHKKWYRYFRQVKNIDEFNHIMHTFNDAWNAFPHRILGGKSPNQIATEAIQKNPELRKSDDQKQIPKMIVGGREMSWDDYQAMISEMEKTQTPFRTRTKKHLLPAYRRYLENKFTKRTSEKHFYVADMFFYRVLHVGFVDLNGIRRDFIHQEFPRWWQTHVFGVDMSPAEIRSSLKKLFQFINLVDDIDVGKFGY